MSTGGNSTVASKRPFTTPMSTHRPIGLEGSWLSRMTGLQRISTKPRPLTSMMLTAKYSLSDKSKTLTGVEVMCKLLINLHRLVNYIKLLAFGMCLSAPSMNCVY